MRWLASLVGPATALAPPTGISPSAVCVTTRSLRLWHTPAVPGASTRQVEVPGCHLFILGFCTNSEDEITAAAGAIATGRDDALSQINGSRYIVATREDDTLIMGDLAGQRIVYFARLGDGSVLASSDSGILAPYVEGGLDERWLMARLLLPDAADVWWSGTPWQQITAVRPAQLLRVAGSGRVSTHPIDSLPAPDRGLIEAGASLNSALQRAVCARIKEAVLPSADLSGGLDSSTVAVLAARSTDRPVSALTLITPGVDDAEPARAVALEVPQLVHIELETDGDLLPYSALDRLPLLDEPDGCAATVNREMWWLHYLAESGFDLHLSGDGGDGVLLARPAYLADLATPRRLTELRRHVNGWARLRHQPPAALIRAAVKARTTTYADASKSAYLDLLSGRPRPTTWSALVSRFDLSGVTTWATPDSRLMVAGLLREHMDKYVQPVAPGSFGIGDTAAWLSLNAFSRGQRIYHQLAAEAGVNHHAPYLDDDVVRACWSVPAWRRSTPETAKPLLRHAFTGCVPDTVLNRSTKGDYTATSYLGLRQNADILTDVFTGSRMAASGLIDEGKVRAEIRRGAAGLPIRLAAFDSVLGTELWLRQAGKTPVGALRRRKNVGAT
ncbi:albusnodin/ikarugamycin family macrolactam cyclase [Kribbella solani]|uniref:albusnodin/ikarugamycin family macrolactam cyclase n=1 Tax=Kribbella solani TaxID=236067 RepID=UPI0029B334EF|nr:albusnodin/ikarugamycin family macrolactam cyclase [Kribbella solani]MDX3000748.1 albusnodin/ikarugamycin family macrolactam cyclase [Kribbella solani]